MAENGMKGVQEIMRERAEAARTALMDEIREMLMRWFREGSKIVAEKKTVTPAQTLQNRLDVVVDLYRDEAKLTNAQIIGILEIVKLNIFMESVEVDEDQ